MLYMIVERFKNGDPVPVYRRFRDEGRRLPEGLRYVASWVTVDMTIVLPAHGVRGPRRSSSEWIAQGSDLVDFEVDSGHHLRGGGPAHRAAALRPRGRRRSTGADLTFRPEPWSLAASGSVLARGPVAAS